MDLLLLVLLLVAPAHSWLSLEEWGSGRVEGSVGEFGQCVCNVFLPDTSFPADRVEHMQTTSNQLSVKVKLQIIKISSLKVQLEVLLSNLSNLTTRVESLESGPDKYIKLEFELLRIELREFEALVTQLKASLNSSSPAFESLYIEIRNMSLIVDQLESYDRSNLEVIRIEFAKLQRKLEKCQDDKDDFSNAGIGSCKHGGILRIGKPVYICVYIYITYATEESKGKLVLGKINEVSFEVEEVWQTSIYKQSVTNAFMICGILYATRSIDTQTEEIFYTFDTNKNEESHVSIPFEKFQDFYMYLDYNPSDQRLYMFNNGYYVYYNVKFNIA
ncbi:olfactomedin-4-like [Sinocyclocheilus rhinocerous]|uniref:olfactomedin-4-like n=1 Tax=Sinocyclocheilus rhinocerous TaxID=307959 RepID=UPI0007BA0890|nr:PREDICTED: olfactomedin-4-like [Sinocyclocheilus rhinocerous]